MVNDSLRTDVSLLYPPYQIALACIHMACVVLSKDTKTWFAELHVDLDRVQVCSVCFCICRKLETGFVTHKILWSICRRSASTYWLFMTCGSRLTSGRRCPPSWQRCRGQRRSPLRSLSSSSSRTRDSRCGTTESSLVAWSGVGNRVPLQAINDDQFEYATVFAF